MNSRIHFRFERSWLYDLERHIHLEKKERKFQAWSDLVFPLENVNPMIAKIILKCNKIFKTCRDIEFRSQISAWICSYTDLGQFFRETNSKRCFSFHTSLAEFSGCWPTASQDFANMSWCPMRPCQICKKESFQNSCQADLHGIIWNTNSHDHYAVAVLPRINYN